MRLNLRNQRLGLRLGVNKSPSNPPSGGPTVPGATTNVSATAGDTQATVTFTAPASTGGSPITGYRATSTPGSITGTAASSPITVTGLTNNTAYTFTVAAENAVGFGPESDASNSVTPVGNVNIIEEKIGTGTSPSITFDSIPSDGERIVLIAGVNVASATLTIPGTFGSIQRETSSTSIVLEVCSRVASSEGSATYSVTTNGAASFIYGARLTAATVGESGKRSVVTGVSAAASSASLSANENSVVFAAWCQVGTSTAASVDQSFTLKNAGGQIAGRGYVAAREFTTATGSINPTLSWTTSRGTVGVLAEFVP